MSACTFFGHSICSEEKRPILRKEIIDLIENRCVNKFYVGNQGQFDRLVSSVLQELKTEYDIDYALVLAYLPEKRDCADTRDFSDTTFPEGIETAPKRFAISWRNRWMIKHSDYVITHVTHSWGGAAQFVELARRQKKVVINI